MDRPALVGWGDGAAVAAFVAATRPERVRALALYGSNIRVQKAPDFPWGQAPSEHEGIRAASDGTWGDVDHIREQIDDAVGYVGALQDDPAFLEWLARMLRNAATPSGARAIDRTWYETDARSALPSIQAPTAFVYRTGDDPEGAFRAEQEHYAGLVPGARLIPLEGREWAAFLGDVDGLVAAIRGFVTGVHEEEIELDRVLATVVFTDLVGSTQRAAELGDRAWRAIRDRHHAAVRAMIGRYRGVEVDTAGDGFLATFDGPARGVRAATAIVEAVRSLGIEVRVGVHTGEVTRSGSGISGIAVHIGARIGALAGPSEVLVSQTVKDLVAGAGLRFTAAGEHELKGVPGEWRVYRVEPPSSP
jgi:class 3 adenylate cyclase